MCISFPTPAEFNGEGREPGPLKLCIGGVLFWSSCGVPCWSVPGAGRDLVKQLLAVILFR
jgi:hypothetical protein